MRKYGRVDDNQNEIVCALRRHGAFVHSLASLGGGVPDLLVAYRGQYALMEVKDGSKPPSKRRLTEDEARWIAACPAPVHIVNSVDEALAVLTMMEAKK